MDKLNRREFMMTGTLAGLAAAAPSAASAQAPTMMTPKSVKPVVIASANGNNPRIKNGGTQTCVEKAFGLAPNLKFTWANALGYPLEDPKAGGQRPRLKYDRLFFKDKYGIPLAPDPAVDEALKAKGLIQEQAPLPGRFEEIVAIAERHGRDPGLLHFPAREIRRLLDDDDWDLGPRLRAHAEAVLATEELPDYPDEMRETFQRLMEEHGIDASKFLPADG